MRRAIQATGAVITLGCAGAALIVSVATPDAAERPTLTAAFVVLIAVGALLGVRSLARRSPAPLSPAEAYRQGRSDARAGRDNL